MANNKSALDFFIKLAKKSSNPQSALNLGLGDKTLLDAQFLEPFLNTDSNLLDVGSGSGLLLKHIYKKVGKITAVEPLKEYSRFIPPADNIQVVNQEIQNFTCTDRFELITCFGIVQYFNIEEISSVYLKLFEYCLPGGRIIIKNQFGVQKAVLIDHFSTELNENYFSHYRTTKEEIDLLSKVGFTDFPVQDIYPPECNRWDDTHFYAISARKPWRFL